jgi:uncharacterized protein YggT (Ycf19 family)
MLNKILPSLFLILTTYVILTIFFSLTTTTPHHRYSNPLFKLIKKKLKEFNLSLHCISKHKSPGSKQ